jgi:hypothetical protein
MSVNISRFVPAAPSGSAHNGCSSACGAGALNRVNAVAAYAEKSPLVALSGRHRPRAQESPEKE